MGLRYRIPFKGFDNESYEVQIYREDYSGDVTELTGAQSCFVVSGTDDDFIYTPIRTSTATIGVLDSELLLDLYSINNQYAPVKLYKNGVLEWTGYIKPEQFTQPYVPTVQNVSVECISALATLENIQYKQQTESGYIILFDLMKYLILSAVGGYRGVYIPKVYGNNTDALKDIEICEENFLSEEMNLLEVLEAVCKFLNWTVYDIGGYIYFIDSDWKGIYRLYDEALTGYSEVTGNDVLLQDIGFNGSDGNTLDVIPGYNKATVKSVNNVFDEVINEEDYDILGIAQKDYYQEDLNHWDKKFLRPKMMKMYYYEQTKPNVIELTQEQIEQRDINSQVGGGVLAKIAFYKDKIVNGEQVPDVEEYPWENVIQLDTCGTYLYENEAVPVFTINGANSVWKDGAISINMSIRYTTGKEKRLFLQDIVNTVLKCRMKIGDYYWNGNQWVASESFFNLTVNGDNRNGYIPIKGNKTPDMPYDNLSGYIIELPTDYILKGKLEFTLYFSGTGGDSFWPGAIIKDIKVQYGKRDGEYDEGQNGDRVYENVVNEKYMSECDEIIFDLGSYNKDGATYSKALMGGAFLTDNLYCAVVGENVRPEELMIRRIVNRYGVTKIKLTEALRMTSSITPITRISERTMNGKSFKMTSGTWDYERGKLTIQIQEDAE